MPAPTSPAIAGRLVDRTFTFDARCVTPSGSAVACSAADPETARLKVTVWSDFRPVSPIGRTIGEGRKITSSATMSLVRQPDDLPTTPSTPPTTTTTTTTVPPETTTTSPPTTSVPGETTTTLPPCEVYAAWPSPTPIPVNGAGKPRSDIAFAVETNGGCGVVTVELNGIRIPTSQSGTVYTGMLGSNDARIEPGTHPMLVLVNDIVVFTGSVEVVK